MELHENRMMLGIIVVLLVLIATAVFFYNRTLNELAVSSCTDAAGPACPHQKIVETQNLVIAILIAVIAAVAGWVAYQLYWKKPALKESPVQMPRAHAPARKIDPAALEPDEKKIVEILQEEQGSAFQSDVIKRLGYTKVKVSRILDRMEQKGLVERKRRGMANLVVLR